MTKLIFFVDDDKMILNLLEYTLNIRQDYEVLTFYSGEECVKNLYRKPDLVVLDHVFKGEGKDPMDGLQTLKQIRQKNSRCSGRDPDQPRRRQSRPAVHRKRGHQVHSEE